ncbi:MAG: TerC family protein [Bacteroidetes bacterium]|nr:TerC family protein [Bacteroidota bacterium]
MLQVEAWAIFVVIVCLLLALDLGVLNKKEHVMSTKEALLTTSFWVFIALLFNVLVYFVYEHNWFELASHSQHFDNPGKTAALEFFTGYIIEKSLSLDNIFVIAMLFSYFKIPQQYQHRVLFWGILGALVFRGVMIVIGAALVQKFDWIMYVFGALLIFSALKMIFGKENEFDADKNKMVQWIRKIYPVSKDFDGNKFFTRINGKRALTPLMLALIIIEASDVLFAVDSIPAIFVITKDPFIVFTSNVFAILGLRSLYFVLVSMLNKFRYLQKSLIVLLLFIGIKMLLMEVWHLPTQISLLIIILILGAGVVVSIYKDRKQNMPIN